MIKIWLGWKLGWKPGWMPVCRLVWRY